MEHFNINSTATILIFFREYYLSLWGERRLKWKLPESYQYRKVRCSATPADWRFASSIPTPWRAWQWRNPRPSSSQRHGVLQADRWPFCAANRTCPCGSWCRVHRLIGKSSTVLCQRKPSRRSQRSRRDHRWRASDEPGHVGPTCFAPCPAECRSSFWCRYPISWQNHTWPPYSRDVCYLFSDWPQHLSRPQRAVHQFVDISRVIVPPVLWQDHVCPRRKKAARTADNPWWKTTPGYVANLDPRPLGASVWRHPAGATIQLAACMTSCAACICHSRSRWDAHTMYQTRKS